MSKSSRSDIHSSKEDDPITELPALLTQDEAVRLLRLDCLGLKYPKEALRHLRRTGQLGCVKINRRILIPEVEVNAFIERNYRKSPELIGARLTARIAQPTIPVRVVLRHGERR